MSIGIVAFLVALAVFFGLYGIYAPRKTVTMRSTGSEFFDTVSVDKEVDAGSAFDRIIRPMLRNFLPQSPLSTQLSSQEHDKITELLVRSGNPWNIRPEEYRGSQYLFATLGLFAGVVLFALDAMLDLIPIVPGFIFLLLFPLMGYVIPFSVHNTARQERAKEVQGQLPEALDLLVVSLSAGQNFEPALAQVAPKMPDGLLKEEFIRITKELSAGLSLRDALTHFARRASSDETEGFAKAVLQAQDLGSDVSDTLKAQSRAARAAYEARLEKKIASLSSRMFIFLIPTMLPAVLIIFLGPSLSQLTGSGIF